jgi:Lrp/AsnC family transcriptional regulator for asnA, asnC and gidA
MQIQPENHPQTYLPDKTDLAILRLLMQDASLPYTEIGAKVFVSPGTVHFRMKKMEEAGLVKGSSLILDPTKFGYDLVVFVGVYLEHGSAYKEVVAEFEKIPEITEAHYITGNYSVFMKIICRNTQHLRQILNDRVQGIPGVQRTETFVSLEESINRSILPS